MSCASTAGQVGNRMEARTDVVGAGLVTQELTAAWTVSQKASACQRKWFLGRVSRNEVPEDLAAEDCSMPSAGEAGPPLRPLRQAPRGPRRLEGDGLASPRLALEVNSRLAARCSRQAAGTCQREAIPAGRQLLRVGLLDGRLLCVRSSSVGEAPGRSGVCLRCWWRRDAHPPGLGLVAGFLGGLGRRLLPRTSSLLGLEP